MAVGSLTEKSKKRYNSTTMFNSSRMFNSTRTFNSTSDTIKHSPGKKGCKIEHKGQGRTHSGIAVGALYTTKKHFHSTTRFNSSRLFKSTEIFATFHTWSGEDGLQEPDMRPTGGQTWRIGRRFETEHAITSLCPMAWAVKQVVFLLAFALQAKGFTVLFTMFVCVCVCARARIHSNVAQQPAAHDHLQLLDSLLLILSEKKHLERTRPHVSSILLFNSYGCFG